MSDKKLWWPSSSGHIDFQMTLEQAQSVSHPGPCDEDVSELRRVPDIAEQLDKIDATSLRDELQEYGVWTEEELSNHSDNLDRLVWIAGVDIAEESRQ